MGKVTFFLKQFKNITNSLSMKSKAIGIVALFLLSFGIIIPMTGYSYAAASDLGGYGTACTNCSGLKGWDNGYIYINRAKCPTSATTSNYTTTCTKLSATKVTITNNVSGCSDSGTTTCYNNLKAASKTYYFSESHTSINVGSSGKSTIVGRNGVSGGNNTYAYVHTSLEILIPKGYYVWQDEVGYDSTHYNSAKLCRAFKDATTNNNGIDTGAKVGPYSEDTMWSGYLGIHIAAAGIVNDTYNKGEDLVFDQRTYQSTNILFKPNTRTIKYNATGGSGTMSNTTYTYNDTNNSTNNTTLRTNTFTRSGWTFKGWSTSESSTTVTYADGATINADTWPATTSTLNLYAVWEATATVYYNSNTTSGSFTSATETLTCQTTGATCNVYLSNAVVNSVGKWNGIAYTISSSLSSLTSASNYDDAANSITLSTSGTYYTTYQKAVTNYYWNSSKYNSRSLYRTEYFTSTSAMGVSLSTGYNTSNYSTETGPGSSAWVGLSTGNDTTAEYSTVAAAAASSSTTLYTIYQFNVTYSKGSNVSSIGSTSASCKVVSSATQNATTPSGCIVTLPSITPNDHYTSVGWNTTSGATTGTAAGQSYTISSNPTTLYANATTAPAATCPTTSNYSGAYDGNAHGINVSGGSGGTIQYRTSTSGTWSNTKPTITNVSQSPITTYVQVLGDSSHATVDCGSKTVTISKKTLTCPSSPSDKTYSGSSQGSGITCPTGSSAGGNTSATNASDSYAQTCTADGNHQFSSACSVGWKIKKYTPTLATSATTGSVNYNSTNTFTATPTTIASCQGTLTAASANTSYVTITGGASNTNVPSGTAKTITYKGIAYTTGTNVNVNYTPTDTNNCNSATQKQVSISVARIAQTVSLNNVTKTYNGSAQAATGGSTTGDGTISYKYYTNSTCTTGETTTAPTNAGTYYVKAFASQTSHYNAGESACKTYTMNKYTPTLAISETAGSVDYNSTNTFTATPTTIASCQGTLTATSASTTYVTVANASSGTYGASASFTNVASTTAKTFYYKGVKVNTSATNVTVSYAPTDTDNCNSAATKTNAITVDDIPATCPTITAYSGAYDGSAHGITVSGGSGGTIQYRTSTTGTWSNTKPTITNVSQSPITTYVQSRRW